MTRAERERAIARTRCRIANVRFKLPPTARLSPEIMYRLVNRCMDIELRHQFINSREFSEWVQHNLPATQEWHAQKRR